MDKLNYVYLLYDMRKEIITIGLCMAINSIIFGYYLYLTKNKSEQSEQSNQDNQKELNMIQMEVPDEEDNLDDHFNEPEDYLDELVNSNHHLEDDFDEQLDQPVIQHSREEIVVALNNKKQELMKLMGKIENVQQECAQIHSLVELQQN